VTTQHQVAFRERSRPPSWVVAVVVVGFGALTVVLPLGYESTWHQVATALLPVLVLLGFTVLIHVEVRDGAVRWARRAGGVHIPFDRLVAVRVQLVALDDDGGRIEHLVAVRDLDGFLTVLGVGPHGRVSEPPVPV
jgi:hypothetical protein